MTAALPLHVEYRVDEGCAHRMARAALLSRIVTPGFLAVLAAELAVGIGLIAVRSVPVGVLFLVVAALFPLAILARTNRLARALAARGFRPGSTMQVEWGADGFVVTTPFAQATHHYRDLRSVVVRAGAVVMRIRGLRALVVLPAELVPDPVRPLLGRPPASG
jgi:hypothetical protein